MVGCTASPRANARRAIRARIAVFASCVCLFGCAQAKQPRSRPDDGTAGAGSAGNGAPSLSAGTGGAVPAAGTGPEPAGSTASDATTPPSDGEVGGDAGGAVDAGVEPADGGAAPASGVRRIAAPPSYRGSVSNSAACDAPYATRGFEPDAPIGERHPLFLYFTGTNFFVEREAFRAQITPGAEAVTDAMARRGFVALQADYDNDPLTWASDHSGLFSCLFGAANPESLLALACALPQVDCELGIATWGHSLGALVAHRAADADARVRAVWTTGYGGDASATLAKERLRVVNGENDSGNGTVAVLNGITGLTATECPDDGRSQCLRPDGSGWTVVRRADCQRSSADHCWFDKLSCSDANPVLEPNWVDPASTKPFALNPHADWVAATARRP